MYNSIHTKMLEHSSQKQRTDLVFVLHTTTIAFGCTCHEGRINNRNSMQRVTAFAVTGSTFRDTRSMAQIREV